MNATRLVALFLSILVLCSACDDDPRRDPTCGNGLLDLGEECDGTNLGGSYCAYFGYYGGAIGCTDRCTFDLSDCAAHGRCGDHILQGDREVCDGPTMPETSCSQLGYGQGDLHCTAKCRYDLLDCPGAETCGDGVLDFNEECDTQILSGRKCSDFSGFTGGDLACGEDCLFDFSRCYREIRCGDGLLQGEEECDGNNTAGVTCERLGYEGGIVSCTELCQLDLRTCVGEVSCGDGVRNGFEECDGADLGGVSCRNMGYHGGVAVCQSDCTLDLRDCLSSGRCGDGVVQPEHELCDGTDFNGMTCSSQGFHEGTLLCGLGCAFVITQECGGACGDGVLQAEYEECDTSQFGDLTSLELGCWFSALRCTEGCEAQLTGDCTNLLEGGAQGSARLHALGIDQFGNLYLAGTVEGSLDGTPLGGRDLFLVKHNQDGIRQWAVQQGGALDDSAAALVVTRDNSVVVVGYAGTPLIPGEHQGGQDALVEKYDYSGQLLFSHLVGSTGHDAAVGVVENSQGELYVVGTVGDALPTQTSQGLSDLFLIKCSADGTLLWELQIGTASEEEGRGIALHPDGGVVVLGETWGEVVPGEQQGGRDLFVARVDSGGNLLWTTQMGTIGDDSAGAVTTDGSTLYLCGGARGTLGGAPSLGGEDILAARLTGGGTPLWVRLLGTDQEEWATACTAGDLLYVAGMTFGSVGGGTPLGSSDGVVLRLDLGSGSFLGAEQFGTAQEDQLLSLVRTDAGYLFVGGWSFGRLSTGEAVVSEGYYVKHLPQ